MLHTRTNSLKPICRIDVTAFASVVLSLVVLMLFLNPRMLTPHQGVGVDLPKVWRPIGMPGANRDGALIVVILRHGHDPWWKSPDIFFGNDRVTAGELPGKIREGLSHGGERKVYLRADARVPYGYVSAVLDGVRSAGVEKIGILVDQKRKVFTPTW